MNRHLPILFLLPGALLAACSSPTGGKEPEPPPDIRVDRIENFVSGQTAKLVGTHLDRISSLTVDGQSVALSGTGATERTFTTPHLRACETDGRAVALVANGSTALTAPIRIPDTFQLRVGESRVLDLAALPKCLQLPAADQDFVITAVNLSRDLEQRLDLVAELRTWTESAAPAASAARTTSSALLSAGHRPGSTGSTRLASTSAGPYSDNPVPFDPTYASASTGDVVQFVDWNAVGGRCDLPRANASRYPVQIVAVSGRTVIGIDMRLPNAAAHVAAATAYQKAADIAGPLLLPTMREIFDPAFDGLKGGGGRFFAIVSPIGSFGSDGGTARPQADCALASEMVTVVVEGAQVWNTPNFIRQMAAVIIHETAHSADAITANGISNGSSTMTGSRGPFAEGFAVLAEETAIRIALGQSVDAKYSSAGDAHPFTSSGLFSSLWGATPDRSPLLISGMYSHASTLLLYAREKLGEAAIGPSSSELLYARLARHYTSVPFASWSVDDLASLVGVTSDALLDQWSLAHATDNLVNTAAAQAAGLPQLTSWDNSALFTPSVLKGGAAIPDRTLSRSTSQARDLRAAPGGYAAAFLLAEAGKGVSVEFTRSATVPARIRITRLR